MEVFMKLKKENIIFISSDNDCKKAIQLLENVSDAERLEKECEEVFKIIKKLVADWDRTRPQLMPPTASEVLRSLMESEAVTQEKLQAATGILQSNISRCLSGKNNMSRKNAEKFAAFFNVDVKLFLSGVKYNINSNSLEANHITFEVLGTNFSINHSYENQPVQFYFQPNNIADIYHKRVS
jgi:antitoxin component HigA of HigAB toxin-antitoxin module